MPAEGEVAGDGRRAWGRWLGALLTLWMALHLSTGRSIPSDDGCYMLGVSYSMVRGLRPQTVHFGLGQSLVLAPVAALVDMERWGDQEKFSAGNWTVKLAPSLLAALAVLLFYEVARRAGAPRGRAILASAIVAAATPLLVYARLLFAEGTLTPCLLLALLPLAWRDPRRTCVADLALCGAGLGFGFLTKVSFVVAMAPILALVLLRERARTIPEDGLQKRLSRLVALAAPMAIAAAIAIWWNVHRYGKAMQFGYNDGNDVLGFRWEFAKIGIPGLLGSAGKSVFLYAPVLLLAVPLWRAFSRGRGALAAACWLSFAGSLALHGSWWAWHGDWAWGPRFLVPYVPPLCLSLVEFPLCAGIRGRLLTTLACALVAASVFVQALGMLILTRVHMALMLDVARFSAHISRSDTDFETVDELRHSHFVPEFSPIRTHAWLLGCILTRDRHPSESCPWRGLGPPEWTRAVDDAPLGEMELDLWVLDDRLPMRDERVVGELCALIAGLAIAVRPRRTPT